MSFHRQNGAASGLIGEKFEEYFDQRGLPMYKDKPYNYSASKKANAYTRQRLIGGVVLSIIILILWLGRSSSGASRTGKTDTQSGWFRKKQVSTWDARREEVRDAFIASWDGYSKYAWGYDIYSPLSKEGEQMNEEGKGMGWIIIDALDTLMIMNLTSRLSHAREWLTTSLNYDQDVFVNTFETTIRMMGGLLSAHYLSTEYPDLAPVSDDDKGSAGEDLYLEKATDLADRLSGAFETESGVPYASVNLKTSKGKASHADYGASSTAEAATLQLEFKYLAYLTGEKAYWEKAEKVMEVIDDNGAEDGLLPIFLFPDSGRFHGDNVRLGSRGDSYYEYLIKQYLQTEKQEPIYKELWDQALGGVRKHLITYSNTSHFTILAERPDGIHDTLQPKMDHLVCFMPGTIALAATDGLTVEQAKAAGRWSEKQESEMKLAAELLKTCYGMYKVMATGLAPEIAFFEVGDPPHMEADGILESVEINDDPHGAWRKDFVIKHNDNHNLQRPETIESLFYMWRITGNETYREWGWEFFESFLKYTKADGDGGYTSLAHANEIPPILKDNMESFWLAETLKYLYLLFSPNDFFPIDKVVYNTEGHIFPRFKLARNLETGWERKPRDASGAILGGTVKKTKTLRPDLPPIAETAPPVGSSEESTAEGKIGL